MNSLPEIKQHTFWGLSERHLWTWICFGPWIQWFLFLQEDFDGFSCEQSGSAAHNCFRLKPIVPRNQMHKETIQMRRGSSIFGPGINSRKLRRAKHEIPSLFWDLFPADYSSQNHLYVDSLAPWLSQNWSHIPLDLRLLYQGALPSAKKQSLTA